MTLPILDNPFNQRVNAIIQKTREMRRGVYWPHLYVVKEDGEPPLRLWALSCLVQDRSDVLPSYQQFITNLKDKVWFALLVVRSTFLNQWYRHFCRSMVPAIRSVNSPFLSGTLIYHFSSLPPFDYIERYH